MNTPKDNPYSPPLAGLRPSQKTLLASEEAQPVLTIGEMIAILAIVVILLLILVPTVRGILYTTCM